MDLRRKLQSALGRAYVLERELGGGALSRVFVARDSSLGRDVVIKVLSPELAGSFSLDRFRREIEVSARLQHPSIVPLLAAGDAGGLPFYTTPFVAGESLRGRLARFKALPIREVVVLLRDVARALAHAHANGVIHRDIKPDNVLVAEDYAVVTDFGIAKALAAATRSDAAGRRASESLTTLGVSLGTPAYMAPEQIAADPDADHRADVYAFGAMAYEALTGETPFAGRASQAILAAHATEAPRPVSARREGIPAPLAELVMRCLEKAPADRPQSADEIVATLTDIATSLGGEIRAPRIWRRISLVGGAVLAIAAAAVATVLAIRGNRSSQPVAVNRGLIAVVPFRVTATDSSLRALRDGMLDLISAKLTGATRTVDTRTLLSAWRRDAGNSSTDLSERQAIGLAKELNAGQLLQGEIVQTNDTLRLTGTLIDASWPQRTSTASVHGPATAVAALVDTLVAKLLVLGAGERAPDALATIPLPALQAYLEGQDAYRAGAYIKASNAFARALEIDSTFAPAGLRLGLAAEWSGDRRAAAGRAIALRYRDRLSETDRLILGPSGDPGQPNSVADLYAQAEQAVQTAPDVPELWHRVGDLLFHFGQAMGVSDAWRRSLAAFEHAIRLDPAFSPSLEHIPILYAELGDTAAALRSLAGRDSNEIVLITRFAVTPDSKDRLALLRSVERLPLRTLVRGAEISVAMGGVWLDYADSLLTLAETRATTSADHRIVATMTHDVALSRGQPERAAAALSQMNAPIGTQVLDALFADGDSAAAASSLPDLRAAVARTPADTEQQTWLTNAFALAQYAVSSGDLTESKHIADALQRFTPTSDTTRRARRARHFATLVTAQIVVLEQRSDARAITERVDSLLRRVEVGDYVGRAGNLIVARLWERLGDTRRAYDATKRFQYTTGLPPYQLTYDRERARLAAALGEREDAIHRYRLYVTARARPEPALATDVEHAKRELARLEKLQGGKT
jgi:eukaryotic-like serine/threonine-protein kinase